MSRLNPREIQRWFPKKWTEIAGNSKCKQMLQQLLREGLCNLIITGPSRTGKTRLTSLLIRAACCPHRDKQMNPCGKCSTCSDVEEGRFAHYGIVRNAFESDYGFFVVDCENVSKAELLRIGYDADLNTPKTIILYDEVAALGRRGLDDSLKKIVDESRAISVATAVSVKKRIWQGRGEKVEGLSFQMLGRFLKEGTSYPGNQELTNWIVERCLDWEIEIVDPAAVIPMIIKRTGSRVGFVIHFLAAAAANGRRLDLELASSLHLDPME